MTARFNDLHDVAQVLSEHISEALGIPDVQPGPPRSVSATTAAGVRITYLYVTPQATHRNDLLERQPDGGLRPPPLSLTCYYLVTTSGADADDPIAAHSALGRIMTLYHDSPTLQLPLSDQTGAPAGAFTELGEGALCIVQTPMILDQIDTIWTAVEPPLQPWALFEVAPVQLISPQEDRPAAPLVRPGGIGLGQPRVGRRPTVVRLAPDPVRPQGRVRIDVDMTGSLEGLVSDGVEVAAADGSLVDRSAQGALVLTLDDGGLELLGQGTHRLVLRASGMLSRRAVLRVGAEAAPAVDAPADLIHDPATDLVLTGANLDDAQEAVLWPDRGVASPADVLGLQLAGGATASSVRVPAAQLATVPAGRGRWRLAVRVGAHGYTPFVVLELAA